MFAIVSRLLRYPLSWLRPKHELALETAHSAPAPVTLFSLPRWRGLGRHADLSILDAGNTNQTHVLLSCIWKNDTRILSLRDHHVGRQSLPRSKIPWPKQKSEIWDFTHCWKLVKTAGTGFSLILGGRGHIISVTGWISQRLAFVYPEAGPEKRKTGCTVSLEFGEGIGIGLGISPDRLLRFASGDFLARNSEFPGEDQRRFLLVGTFHTLRFKDWRLRWCQSHGKVLVEASIRFASASAGTRGRGGNYAFPPEILRGLPFFLWASPTAESTPRTGGGIR